MPGHRSSSESSGARPATGGRRAPVRHVPTPAEVLLDRMRRGDREAAAEFMVRYAPLIRRRFRSLARSARPLLDSEDVFSTIARRLDELVLSGSLKAASVQELWALIGRVTVNRAIDQTRAAAREREAAALVAAGVRRAADAAEEAEHAESCVVLSSHCATRLLPGDRELVRLRVASRPYSQIARALGMAVPAARKRWERIAAVLRRRIRGR